MRRVREGKVERASGEREKRASESESAFNVTERERECVFEYSREYTHMSTRIGSGRESYI